MAPPKRQEKYSELSTLSKQVKARYLKGGSQSNEEFLPYDVLGELVTKQSVLSAFKSTVIDKEKYDDLAKWVVESGKRLFLILVLLTRGEAEQLSWLEELKDDGVDDSEWEDNDLQLFETHQWPLSSPIFGGSTKFRHQLDIRQPLPYLNIAKKPASSGFFGEVSRAEIHPAHIDLQRFPALGAKLGSSSNGIAIAIKKAKDNEDLYEFFDKETSNLKALQEIVSPHLIQPIAAYQRGSERCLTFPWADGGNLGNYWEGYEKDRQDLGSLRWLIAQFTGLFSALHILHKQNCRHGDLKPENILWFKERRGKGTLRIADLGLARFHERDADTKKRNFKGMSTMTPSGTSRYEPPEMDDTRGKDISRSRQYDIWSMGCITIELLIWLIKTSYSVNDYVVSCLDIMEKQLENSAAYTALLKLVRERILVIDVSEDYVSSPNHREIAGELCVSMLNIQKHCEDQGYLTSIDLKYPSSDISAAQYKKEELLTVPETPDPHLLYKTETSEGLLGTQGTTSKIPRVLLRAPTGENDPNQSSHFECDLSELESSSRACGLCRLLLDSLYRHGERPPKTVPLRCDGAVVGIENGPNLLSIYVDPQIGPDRPEGAQLGLAKLPAQGSREQFTLLKEWIKACDKTHGSCRGNHDGGNNENYYASTMPTRLVELEPTLRIVESSQIKPSRYIALSHCWGKLSESERFCAFNHNISQLKESIKFNALPKTFRDAITVARGIGVSYLWIDSLCIIQDNKDDWEHELIRMEQVFSSAYCTIAASSSVDSLKGFLDDREPRACVKIETSDKSKKTFYVCPNIDDFHRDVDLGELNSRGWVLQERALSRRTIFYTSTQVYWECGEGVHCETLARLQNSKAAFLGDANFPDSALEYYRDGRQMLVQDLYERYSGLKFTKDWDRPVAILGLQERLAKAFKTQAAYGFFDTYFARLLLWKRRDRWMTRITQRPGSRYHVPTWSWFSKVGAIKYLDLKFQETNWAVDDFENPFKYSAAFSSGISSTGEQNCMLRGRARKLTMSKLDMLRCITFDEGQEFEVKDLRCVLIGQDKIGSGLENVKYHVLIIHEVGDLPGECVYERVGVASLKPDIRAPFEYTA
ncbi:hypothetical protein GQX73_g1231 [Xylaria multiplex]|uniref:Protein kinase domain-containing protein n=1 Tax=Xylaria multiplex TaxID=323545 RepID=A0A7C8J2G5_9PEZI|nr:hypothetical protein GQX73_g1231 [Xylaria multiplex]